MQVTVDAKYGTDPVSRVAVLSFLVNLSLVGIKLALSYVSGSLALRADAVHSLVDVLNMLNNVL
jgi:divalent metal cation (Fe/Co/Zn/Cd) transporter